jgi:hypothetical protein
MKNTLKSIWAIFAGFIIVAILSVVTDMIFSLFDIFPIMTNFSLFVAFIYRSIYTIVGGYVTASLAPNKPMRHVIILGYIGTFFAIVGVIVGWKLSAHWYPVLLALTSFLFIHMGGRIRLRMKNV